MSSPEIEQMSSLDRWLSTEFKEEYESQAKILDKLGLLELLPECGEMGIRGIDGKEYPIPSKEQIIQEIRTNREKYETKIKQGFIKIQLTPFGVPLEKLTTILEQRILAHHKEGKLLATKENPNDPDVKLELDTNQPLFKWDDWIDPNAPEGQRGADVTGKCVYHPQSFDQNNHQGFTKEQLLEKQTKKHSSFAGWNVLLIETSPNIPREGKGKTIGGRKQLETNKTPNDYLKLLQTNPDYQNEQGQTNEDWLTQFLVHLEQTNQVIDDYSGKGSANFLAGSFNPSAGYLGYGYWVRDRRQALLVRDDPRNRYSGYGLRSAVGVGN